MIFLMSLKYTILEWLVITGNKMARKILGQLIAKPQTSYSKSSDVYDERLLDDKIPACFHLNYIMDSSNPVGF